MRNQYEKVFAEVGAGFETLRPMDGDGKFVEDGERFCELGRSAKNSDKTMLYDFISESLENRKAPHKWIKIGDIDNEAQNRIMQKCGAKVSEIHIDNSGIIHAMSKPQHNLKHGDLLLAVDVINSTNNISLSEKKHKSNVVLIFKDVDDEITFLTEVHVKNGYLLVFDAWRQKKARRDPDAAKRPPEANVRNESPPADA